MAEYNTAAAILIYYYRRSGSLWTEISNSGQPHGCDHIG